MLPDPLFTAAYHDELMDVAGDVISLMLYPVLT
jgi:hypothetical protein